MGLQINTAAELIAMDMEGRRAARRVARETQLMRAVFRAFVAMRWLSHPCSRSDRSVITARCFRAGEHLAARREANSAVPGAAVRIARGRETTEAGLAGRRCAGHYVASMNRPTRTLRAAVCAPTLRCAASRRRDRGCHAP